MCVQTGMCLLLTNGENVVYCSIYCSMYMAIKYIPESTVVVSAGRPMVSTEHHRLGSLPDKVRTERTAGCLYRNRQHHDSRDPRRTCHVHKTAQNVWPDFIDLFYLTIWTRDPSGVVSYIRKFWSHTHLSIALIALRTRSTHRSVVCIPAFNAREAGWWVVAALGTFYLTSLAFLQRPAQGNCLLPLNFDLRFQFSKK